MKRLKNNKLVVIAIMALVAISGCDVQDSGSLDAEKHFEKIDVLEIDQMLKQPAADPNQTSEQDEQSVIEQNQPVSYPENLELTVSQCRQIALENNLDIKAVLVSPEMAEETLNAERAKFEWAFTAGVDKSKTDTPTSTALDGSKVDNLTFGAGVKAPLQTGGEINLNFYDNKYETNNLFSTLNPAYSNDVSFSISQPLLRNAGPNVNNYSIRISAYDNQITQARTKLEIISVIAAADRVYWRLYAAQRLVEVKEKENELAIAQMERAKHFVDAGQFSKIELTRAKDGVARGIEGIIIAKNLRSTRERELKRVLNMMKIPVASPTIVLPSSEPNPYHYEIDANRMVKFAIENRMEMLELELELIKDVETIDYLKNQVLPLVSVNYTYNINGLGAVRSDAYDVLWDKNFEDHRIGLSMLIPLGNGAAKSRLRRSVLQRSQRIITKQRRSDLIELEVLNAIDQLEANWRKILAARQSTMLATELFEAEKKQFELGLNTSRDVLESQTSLANSRSAEIEALTSYEVALVDIAYATGTVLGASSVELDMN